MSSDSAGLVLAYEIIGIPAADSTALAPIVAPEHAAPTTPTTPASIRVCAEVAAWVPSQPESANTSSNCTPWLYARVFASCRPIIAEAVKPGAYTAIGPVIGFR